MLMLNDLRVELLQSVARNLVLKIKALRDSSSPTAPRNDKADGFFQQPAKRV